MAKYRLTAAAVINDRYHEAGEEVDYDGVPGPHMEPLDADAKKAAATGRAMPELDPDMLSHREERTTPGTSRGRRDG